MNSARNLVKQMQATTQQVGDYLYYIYPFPAFQSANLIAELAAQLSPVLGGMAAAIGANGDNKLSDMKVEDAVPHIVGAFSMLSGDKLEGLMRKLLLSGNVAFQTMGGESLILTEEASNEIFCGNAQDMFILAYHVIRVNYSGFFDKFGNLFGRVTEIAGKMMSTDMEPSTQDGSVT